MLWTDIVGHSENVKMLRHMESSRRMPHAILLSGPSGIGKFMVASVLGTALLCLATENRPCGECQSCLQMLYGTHPDYLLIRPEGLAIKIEQIRKLQQEAALAPYVSLRRVCIIDQAELMTVQAANSLLKVLEEPVGDVVFILVSGNRQMLLATILSRCMAIRFQPLSDIVLAQALMERNFSPESSIVAARLSRGRMGNALTMLEPDGLAIRNQAVRILESLSAGNGMVIWDTATLLEKMERSDLLQIVEYFSYLLRDLLMVVTGQDLNLLLNGDLAQMLCDQGVLWNEQRLLKALGAVENARRALNGNANARLTSEALLIKIHELVKEV